MRRIFKKIKENAGMISLCLITLFLFSGSAYYGYSNFDSIKLDKTRADGDIVFGNGEYIHNNTDGSFTFSAGNLVTTGDMTNTGDINVSGDANFVKADYFYLGSTTAAVSATDTGSVIRGGFKMKVYNAQSGGNDIVKGDLLELYATAIEFAADTAIGAVLRITNQLDGTVEVGGDAGGWDIGIGGFVKWARIGTATDDTLIVVGTDPAGNAIIDTLVVVSGSGTIDYGNKIFGSITSASGTKITGGAGTQTFDVISFLAVKASAGANVGIIGVAAEAIVDSGGIGWAYVAPGTLAKVTVDANSLAATPGILLQGASGGDAVTIAAADADTTANGKLVGLCLQPGNGDNQLLWIYLTLR